jgi:hypothetical protein
MSVKLSNLFFAIPAQAALLLTPNLFNAHSKAKAYKF